MSISATYELAGIELESPLINAAGSINGPLERLRREGDMLAETAIGAITYGSFTLPSQVGNEAVHGSPVFYYDRNTQRAFNAIGLENIGEPAAVQVASELVERSRGKPVIFSGSPTNAPECGTSVEQAVKLASSFLNTEVTFVELNVGCPNIVTAGGGRKPIMGYDLDSMESLFDTLEEEVGEKQRLLLKLPPYLSEEERKIAQEIALMLNESAIFRGVVGPNTIPGQPSPVPLSVPGGTGGMSGPDTKEIGREQLIMWRDVLNDDLGIVSTEGVFNGRELAVRRELGAAAAGGVTFLWISENWKDAVTTLLLDFASEESADN